MKIERKFKVFNTPNLDGCIYQNIAQGYISLKPEIKIRKVDDSYFVTKKVDKTFGKEEQQVKIDKAAYEILKTEVKGQMLEKTKYFLPFNDGNTVELDIYRNSLAGLKIAKVEFTNKNEAYNYTPPSWFGEDITCDKRFKNKNLSTASDASFLKEAHTLSKTYKR